MIAVLVTVACVFGAVTPAEATDYYVSPAGNDASSGSSGAPWRTINRVNAATFAPGDRVLFLGGQSFSGSVLLDSGDVGTAARPITISSYGSGRATVTASGVGLYAYNTAGIVVDNINFAGASGNNSAGVMFYADAAGSVAFDTVVVSNSDISGFANYGIVIGSWNGLTGYRNVRVSNAVLSRNARGGVQVFGDTSGGLYPHANVTVTRSRVFDNPGVAGTSGPDGSGIVLGQVDHGTIDHCVVYNNGTLNTAGSGPVGIWTYGSNDILIQYNESHHNHTSNIDGDGFDLDGGTTNSVVQYNYSHDNDGAGYLLAAYPGGSPHSGNIIRYNISQNDGRTTINGGIYVWDGAGNMSGNLIDNNTVFTSTSPYNATYGMVVSTPMQNTRIRNNLFLSSGAYTAPLTVAWGQSGVSFENNVFFSDYASSLPTFADAWHTGDSYVDPRLNAPGTAGTLNNTDNLGSLTQYQLATTSPVRDSGVDIAAHAASVPATDFFGNATPRGSTYDLGAFELPAATNVVGAFGKSAPGDGATGQSTSVTLAWSAAPSATDYAYCLANVGASACTSWTSVGANTSVSVAGLVAASTYYWQVKATNGTSTSLADGGSAVWSFSTQGVAPGAFGRTAPSNSATGQATSLTLTWGASSGATSYEYCVDTTNDGACSGWVSAGAATSASLSGLVASTTYYWHVRALNTFGTTYASGGSSTFWSFTTQGVAPGSFSRTTPSSGATGQATTLTLTWAASSGATSYEYCVDTTNDGACSGWVSAGAATSASLSGLTANTTYYWQARASNTFGTTYASGGSSTFWSFTTQGVQGTAPGAFNRTSPSNSATGQATSLTLTWGASSGATSYEYCVDTTNDGACSGWVSTGTTTSASWSGPTANTTYYWHVRALNTFGTTYASGGSSAFWSFTTQGVQGTAPGAFNRTSPSNSATGQATSLTLTWGASSGATSYDYCVDTKNDGACSGWVSTGTTTSASLSGLTASTTYYWHVRATNTFGTTYASGGSSTFWSFTTQGVQGTAPGAFNRTSPSNGATGQATSLTLTWAASSGATSYEYCVDTTNDGACSGWVSTGTTTSASLSGLAASTTYYWHVRATNTFGTTYASGGSSAFWSFATQTSQLRTAGDLDGDAKADVTIYRPTTGGWWTLKSQSNYSTYSGAAWGLAGDLPEPGDYDGDGKLDLAIYRPSTGGWWIAWSTTNFATYNGYPWGLPGDMPVPADYDGDGKTDIAIYRPSNGAWWILTSSTHFVAYAHYTLGIAGDVPVPGDFDGDGKADPATYRAATGTWSALASGSNYANNVSFDWGLPGDVPVPGDYDGDGRIDPAIYRPSTGGWWIAWSRSGYTTYGGFTLGMGDDLPIPADYDGDGRTDLAVYRPTTGAWSVLTSSSTFTAPLTFSWGLAGDVPIYHRP